MLPFSASLLDSSEDKTRNGKFMFRYFLDKMECKKQCLFRNLNNFLATKIVLAKRASDR